MPKASAARLSTGLKLLGYLERPPWLWLVDLDAKVVAPAAASMPGNGEAVSAVCYGGTG